MLSLGARVLLERAKLRRGVFFALLKSIVRIIHLSLSRGHLCALHGTGIVVVCICIICCTSIVPLSRARKRLLWVVVISSAL